MRRVLLLASTLAGPWLACQPIIIGVPAAELAGTSNASAAAGEGGAAGSLLPGPGGAAPEAGGAAGEGGAADACTDGTFKLEGHVHSSFGAPVIGVPVEVTGATSASTTTDLEGYFQLEGLCPGSHRVVPRCAAGSARLTLTGDTVHDFTALPGGCDATAVKPHVLVVAFDPFVPSSGDAPRTLSATLGFDPPDMLAQQLFDELRAASNGHAQFEVATPAISLAAFPPLHEAESYTAAEYEACLDSAEGCRDVSVDFAALTAQHDLCEVAQAKRVDQIWLLGGDHFGFADLEQLECAQRPSTQEGVRQVDVLGLSYGAGLSGLLAGFQAHADRVLREVFDEVDSPYAALGQAFSSYDATKASHSCGELDCTERSFRRYWFSQLPREKWLDGEAKFNDFWRYLVRPADRQPRGAVAVACSSSYLPGWCEQVKDTYKGECNSSEWATLDMATGWVEFMFDPPRLVSGVQLYDRACSEQVLSGHLEFSDGSEDVEFGKLPQAGTDFARPKFEPKRLSGLRVVIDSSSGGNPGFGEITLIPQL